MFQGKRQKTFCLLFTLSLAFLIGFLSCFSAKSCSKPCITETYNSFDLKQPSSQSANISFHNFQAECLQYLSPLTKEQYPMMSPEALLAFESVLDQIIHKKFGRAVYLEWGSGGSTRMALQKNFARIFSIDNEENYCNILRKEDRIRCAIVNGFLRYNCVTEGGPTKGFGVPKDPTTFNPSPYLDAIDAIEGTFDVVLIDGRYRPACAAKAWNRLAPGGIMMMHHYHDAYNVDIVRRFAHYSPLVSRFYKEFHADWLGYRRELGIFQKNETATQGEVDAALQTAKKDHRL